MRFRTIRLAGHPLHPALAHLPIGAWVMASLSDAAALWTGDPRGWLLAYGSLAVGLAAAVPAAVIGTVDFLALSRDDPASRTGIYHLAAVLTAAVAYLTSLLLRGGPDPPASPIPAVSLAAAGLVLLILGGWLGAELVYRHRVGVGSGTEEPDREEPGRMEP